MATLVAMATLASVLGCFGSLSCPLLPAHRWPLRLPWHPWLLLRSCLSCLLFLGCRPCRARPCIARRTREISGRTGPWVPDLLRRGRLDRAIVALDLVGLHGLLDHLHPEPAPEPGGPGAELGASTVSGRPGLCADDPASGRALRPRAGRPGLVALHGHLATCTMEHLPAVDKEHSLGCFHRHGVEIVIPDLVDLRDLLDELHHGPLAPASAPPRDPTASAGPDTLEPTAEGLRQPAGSQLPEPAQVGIGRDVGASCT
jgi:hypothetical protein